MILKKCKVILFSLTFILTLAPAAFSLMDNWSHYEDGMRMMSKKNYNQAFTEFTYYINHPEFHRHMFGIAYFGRALMFQELKNYGRAIEEYKLAIENDLHPVKKIADQAYMNIGTIYMERKAYQDAIGAYTSAVASNKQSGFAHYYLGLAYLRAGEYEKAEKESEEAKRLGITFTALADGLNKAKGATQNKVKTEEVK